MYRPTSKSDPVSKSFSSENRYYSQLDFLRFIAVTLVILEHWFGAEVSRLFDFGFLGVSIFFTLSGFLITGILLRNKRSLEEGISTRKEILKSFYIRRTLRIFPIYYLLLVFLYIFSFEGIRQKVEWYAFYASNIYSYKQQAWDGMIGPLWSLAVEEQFYLVWPILILLIPFRKLSKFFLICLLAAPLFRLLSVELANYCSENPLPSLSMRILMPNCIDAFAAGGFLALWKHNNELNNAYWKRIKKPWMGLLLLALSAGLLIDKESYVYYLLFPSIFSWFSVFLISNLLSVFSGWKGMIFNNPFFLYLGKISYGLYLYHGPFPLIFGIIDFVLLKAGTGISVYNGLNDLNTDVKHFIWVLYLIVLASISFYVIEKPFNGLKRKFSYK